MIASEIKELSTDEKINWIEMKKVRANQLLKDNKFVESSEVYLDALCGFSFEDESEEFKNDINLRLKVPIINNLVLLLMKWNMHANAAIMAD